MKVLLVANGFPPSGQWGTEYYTHQLAVGMRARGLEVSVLVPSREPGRERYSLQCEPRYGVDVWELANAGDPSKAFSDSYSNARIEEVFDELLAGIEPDVVHFTHLLWGLSVGLPRVARRRGARTVVTLTDFGLLCHRGQLYDWQLEDCEGPTSSERCARCVREPAPWDARPLNRELWRAAVSGAAALGGLGRVVVQADIEERERCIAGALGSVDHWIFPTRALAGPFRAAGLALKESSCVPYGIDESSYLVQRVPRNGTGTRFVYMSQYMPHKGLQCLLEAVRLLETRLPESVEPWQVELHGNGGSDRARLYSKTLVEDGLPRRVTDCGAFEPLSAPEVLARTDCVLVPSEWRENAPLTILQARAAGVPVIASDVPGVREVLAHGEQGLLFPPGDAGALAAAMAEVISGRFRGIGPAPLVTLAEHLDVIRSIYHTSQSDGAAQDSVPSPLAGRRPGQAGTALGRA